MKSSAFDFVEITLDCPFTDDQIRDFIFAHNWYRVPEHRPIAQPFLDAGFHVIRVEHVPEHNLWSVRLRVPDGSPWPEHRALRRQVRDLLKESKIATADGPGVYKVRRPYLTCTFADQAGPPPFDPAWLEPVED